MPARTTEQKTLLSARAVERTLKRMADEIVELNDGTTDLIIVRIQRRGVQLASRIVALIEDSEGVEVPQGSWTTFSTRGAPSGQHSTSLPILEDRLGYRLPFSSIVAGASFPFAPI